MDEKVCRQLNLSWGVRPILLGEEWEVFVLFERAINACKRDGLLEKGDVTVITSGVPIGRSGTTNMLKVQAQTRGRSPRQLVFKFLKIYSSSIIQV